ncbi:C40 family peptidase [Streptomyces sp. NPDC090106]|uniref:C40 family peptidase n=1 Tax=Streptomyces sp. NPDC090106 TaxID=3365946 RepID=UPI0037F4A2F9
MAPERTSRTGANSLPGKGNSSAADSLAAEGPSRDEVRRRVNRLYDRAEDDTGTFNATRAGSIPRQRGGAGGGRSQGGDGDLEALTRQWFNVARAKLGPTVPVSRPGREPSFRPPQPRRSAEPLALEAPKAARGSSGGGAPLELTAGPAAPMAAAAPMTAAAPLAAAMPMAETAYLPELPAAPAPSGPPPVQEQFAAPAPAVPDGTFGSGDPLWNTGPQQVVTAPAPEPVPSAMDGTFGDGQRLWDSGPQPVLRDNEPEYLQPQVMTQAMPQVMPQAMSQTMTQAMPQAAPAPMMPAPALVPEPSISLPAPGLPDPGFPANGMTTYGAGSMAPMPAPAAAPAPAPVAAPAPAPYATGTGWTTDPTPSYGAGLPTDPTPSYGAGLPAAPAPAPAPQPVAAAPAPAPWVASPQPGGAAHGTKGERVVAFAREQIGRPCVWGASGPGSYDAPGLTQAAWKMAGVTLPRTSVAQSAIGTPVALAEVRPGDLIFFLDDLGHVGVWAGNGVMIHAPGPGAAVREESVFFAGEAAIRGAVRPA